MIESKINVIIEMKNLIILFFMLCSIAVKAQNNEVAVNVEQKKSSESIKVKHRSVSPKPIATTLILSVKSNILEGFSKGNAKLLSAAFPSNVDISILGKSNLYSRSQAEQVLSTFFTQHKVSAFTIEHEGNSNGTKYFIGTYTSGKTQYRVTVNVKISGGKEVIKSITIEA